MVVRTDYTSKLSIRIILGYSFILFLGSCDNSASKREVIGQEFDYSIDTTGIPKDTIDFKDLRVSFVNGIYYLDKKAFSGIVYKVLKGYNVKTYSSVLNGMLHGSSRSFYENGQPYEVRQYRTNYAVGKQYGYWEDTDNLKFEYNYYNQKKEGVQKSWYATGEPYYVYNYKDDCQEGMQQAWRKNGSLFRNFVVKNGVRYGLQKSISCTALVDGKITR